MGSSGDDLTLDGPSDAGYEGARRRLVALLDGEPEGSGAPRRAAGSPVDRPRGPTVPGTDPPTGRARLERLCLVALPQVDVDGAGVTVIGGYTAGEVGHRDQLVATGRLTRHLEDLQLMTGEGPGVESHRTGAPVLVGDLGAERSRWLGFAPEAITAGVAAVFSLPLQVGAVRLGTLDLHRTTPGLLSRAQHVDALVLTGLITETLLELDDLTATGSTTGPAGWLPHVHADVHVASGMVAAAAGIHVGTALLRIRSYAYAREQTIDSVARRIIDRDPTLDDLDHPEDGPGGPWTEQHDR